MSIYVYGLIPPDQNYLDKLAAYQACEKAKVPIPKELSRFFDDQAPDPKGMQRNLTDAAYVEKYNPEMCEGVEIDLTKLPPAVKTLRVYKSY